MKRFLIISVVVHISLFLLVVFCNLSFLFPQPEFKQTNTVHIEFLETLPVNKNLSKPVMQKPKDKPKPKEADKETSPPPKPEAGIKTKSTAPEPTKDSEKEEHKKVAAPKEKLTPKKNNVVLKENTPPPPKKEKEKKLEETAKKTPKPDSKQQKIEKPTPGIEKKKQEVESVDALLNTLLPDVGGERDEKARELKEQDSSEMPDQLENEAVDEIRSQIEAVWNYNPTPGIDFYLRIKIDPSGKIVSVQLSGTEGQNALQQAAAEAAYRSTVRLEQFELKPHIFKIDFHGNWGDIEVHFHPQH